MELGIALDGTGRLGSPAAMTAVATAADRLGYGSVWCIGPWAPTLLGALAVASSRVRIGIEARGDGARRVVGWVGGDRLTVVDRLPLWSPPSPDAPLRHLPAGPVRLDASTANLASAIDELDNARRSGASEVVVLLVDDPGVDEALAAYAELGELVEGTSAGCA